MGIQVENDLFIPGGIVKKKKIQKWEPFERAVMLPKTQLQYEEMATALGVTADDIKKVETNEMQEAEVWKNNLYQVIKKPVKTLPKGWSEMIHLSIRRLDRHPLRDWRHFQRIKNELVGPENEAIEIYPSEKRLVDTANEFHLWVFKSTEVMIPVGYFTRMVTDKQGGGAKQRKFTEEEE